MINRNLESSKRAYIKRVRRSMGKITDLKRAFIDDIKDSMQNHIDENGDASYKSFCKALGEPEIVAAGFWDNKDYSRLAKRARKYKVWRATAIVFAILLVVTIAVVYPHIISNDGYIKFTNVFFKN